MSDCSDANKLIIESVPLDGRSIRLLDQRKAAQIRIKMAEALGLEDEDLAMRLAHFQRTGQVWRSAFEPGSPIDLLSA